MTTLLQILVGLGVMGAVIAALSLYFKLSNMVIDYVAENHLPEWLGASLILGMWVWPLVISLAMIVGESVLTILGWTPKVWMEVP